MYAWFTSMNFTDADWISVVISILFILFCSQNFRITLSPIVCEKPLVNWTCPAKYWNWLFFLHRQHNHGCVWLLMVQQEPCTSTCPVHPIKWKCSNPAPGNQDWHDIVSRCFDRPPVVRWRCPLEFLYVWMNAASCRCSSWSTYRMPKSRSWNSSYVSNCILVLTELLLVRRSGFESAHL